ncbi:mitochondrial 2-oxoglutarate/malate carrier protein-like [Amyelois transitella]|uniref:mitochondrial 2-oxoglutarate/malate carrier protein-like n=1 Tax=Amyelois transitella TaxID=680683 RepID=UPI0029907498|nr:mitochondrial 2-oxoglutarate/malate carrier protein-like [Amyelois transitella]
MSQHVYNTYNLIKIMAATLFVHPLDVLKIRLQISPERVTSVGMAHQMLKYEGWPALYCGLTAGLLRQATYTAARLATYEALTKRYIRNNKKPPEGNDKILVGVCAGLVGGLVGNPSEVVLVRRMAEGCLPCPAKCGRGCCPSGYLGTVDGFRKIICSEGFMGLFRGTTLTLLRSVGVSIVHIGCYNEIREYVKERTGEKDPDTLTMYTAVALSFVTALLTHPIDVVKTFFQISRSDCITQRAVFNRVIRTKGVFGLWKGFTPYFIRMAIHTMIALLVMEHLKDYK